MDCLLVLGVKYLIWNFVINFMRVNLGKFRNSFEFLILIRILFVYGRKKGVFGF